ncbi:hypothetical protein SNEBB_001120, partial [Seison nebaliae]
MDAADVGRAGRPYGGCGIVWRSDLRSPPVPIATTSRRLCAVRIRDETKDIVLVSVYMPVDDNTTTSYEIYGDTLSELEAIMQTYSDSCILLGGDFNVDFSRASRNKSLLEHFLADTRLRCVTSAGSHNVNFTYEAASGARSLIDYFFISESMFGFVEDFKILNDAVNLSQHFPIAVDIKIDMKVVKNKVDNLGVLLDWDKATDQHISRYKHLLSAQLNLISIPDRILTCSNFNCAEHCDEILKLFNLVVKITRICGELAIPKKKVGMSRGKPGWTEFVEPFREKSIFWHGVWKSAGSPNQGQLYNLRRFTRSKYHWAIKHIKKNADYLLKCKTANFLKHKSFTDFWRTIRKMKATGSHLSCVVDGKVTDDDIANAFACKYSELYSSVGKGDIRVTKASISHIINRSCSSNLCSDVSCHTISSSAVLKAINSLKRNKKDEIHHISSNHLIAAPKELLNCLAHLFTAMLKHGCSDYLFNSAFIKPIPKNKQKSLSDSSNYRAISLNPILSKLLDYVIIDKIDNNMQTSHLQFAYKSDYSTTMCTFMVAETIQYYRSKGSNVYVLLLDATKAFDRVQYSRLIMNMYLQNNATVKWNNSFSNNFPLKNGVKQGGVLSPMLFAAYLDPLLNNIHNSKQGCHMGNICANAFAYADDIVVLSPTCSGLRQI